METKPRGGYAVYDMTHAYRSKLKDYKRGYWISDERRSLTLRDEFVPKSAMVSDWFLMTEADVEIVDNNTAILTKGGEKLQLKIFTNRTGARLTVGAAEPLPTSNSLAGQNKNAGWSRVMYNFTATADNPSYVLAKMSLVGEAASETPVLEKPVSEWSLRDIPDGELPKREKLSVRNIYVDGVNIRDISEEFIIPVTYGERMPEITAEAADPAKTPEIIPAASPSGKTVIRVKSNDGTRYRDVIISYSVTYAGGNLTDYDEYRPEDAVASSEPEPDNHKFNSFDKNYDTRWTAFGIGEWISYDLGGIKDLDAVGLSFWRGNERTYGFEVSVSKDGSEWKTVTKGTASGTTGDMEIVPFEQREQARYIKITGNGNTANVNVNIVEFAALKKK
jgi:hypothetical protein